MRKKITYTILFISLTFSLKAEGFRILVNWEGLSDTTIMLAHYYDSKIYINDTLQLDQSGQTSASADTLLPQGLYMLYLNGESHFDFLLGEDQTLSISTNQNNIFDNLKIKGAIESEKFLNYQKILKAKGKEKSLLYEKTKSENKDSAAIAKKRIEELDNSLLEYINNKIKNEGNTMYKVFLKASTPITVPEPPVEKTNPKYDSIAWNFAYTYNINHFLDGIDFTDERIIYTPLLKSKLDQYFNHIILPIPDSIIPQALKYIHKAEPCLKMYQYISQFLFNNSVQSKIMGMDKVMVAIADEVYLNHKAFWIDDETYRKIAEEVYLTRPNLIGNQAPDIIMKNIDGQEENIYDSQGKYTILVFYEYDCGHCKKDIPAMYDNVYMKYIDEGIEVYAICMNNDKEKWKTFVEEKELAGWHHLWDPENTSKYRYKYYVKTTPIMYLLDKDKKIIAKRIDNESLSKLLESFININ